MGWEQCQKRAQVGRGLFGVHLLIPITLNKLYYRYQIKKIKLLQYEYINTKEKVMFTQDNLKADRAE